MINKRGEAGRHVGVASRPAEAQEIFDVLAHIRAALAESASKIAGLTRMKG